MAESHFKPVVALVGRTNVGKSTLFNRLTRSRAALVANISGLTRDRHYGEGRVGEHPYIVVDTGGFEPVATRGILVEMARQTAQAIAESDVVIFLVDGREGINAHDHEIARLLRKSGQRVLLAVNKTEGMRHHADLAQFPRAGIGRAASDFGGAWRRCVGPGRRGARPPAGRAGGRAPQRMPGTRTWTRFPEAAGAPDRRIKLAPIAGRPNVGKSTLINTLVGEDRVIAYDLPGTTRDAIEIEFERGDRRYTLIDTAGLRRRGKVFETVEKFSVIKTLQAIEAANVVLLLIDASDGISDQDAHIAGFITETGRALVVGLNKWDAVDREQREWVQREYDRKLRFLSFARVLNLSALKGQGVGPVLKAVDAAHAAAFAKLSTPKLTRTLQAAIEQQPPPRKGIFRPKMRYAHQGGQNPPRIIIHGNALDAISDSYRRYLEGQFREAFKLAGTPLSVEFKSSHNPYLKDDS